MPASGGASPHSPDRLPFPDGHLGRYVRTWRARCRRRSRLLVEAARQANAHESESEQRPERHEAATTAPASRFRKGAQGIGRVRACAAQERRVNLNCSDRAPLAEDSHERVMSCRAYSSTGSRAAQCHRSRTPAACDTRVRGRDRSPRYPQGRAGRVPRPEARRGVRDRGPHRHPRDHLPATERPQTVDERRRPRPLRRRGRRRRDRHNAAGRAATHLKRYASRPTLDVRRDDGHGTREPQARWFDDGSSPRNLSAPAALHTFWDWRALASMRGVLRHSLERGRDTRPRPVTRKAPTNTRSALPAWARS